MELNEAEKRQLFQVDGDCQAKVLDELYMTARFTRNPEQRDMVRGLMAKLRVLSNEQCMDLVKDIQKNYHLPYPRTMGERIALARQQSGAEKLKGHDIMALERFDPRYATWLSLMCFLLNPLSEIKAIRCACSSQTRGIGKQWRIRNVALLKFKTMPKYTMAI